MKVYACEKCKIIVPAKLGFLTCSERFICWKCFEKLGKLIKH